jgi:hypothetical protein
MHGFGAHSSTFLFNRAAWTAASNGTYLVAQDLESMSHKSTVSEAGINTLSVNTQLVGQFSAALAAPLNVQTYAHFDALLIVANGRASVIFSVH